MIKLKRKKKTIHNKKLNKAKKNIIYINLKTMLHYEKTIHNKKLNKAKKNIIYINLKTMLHYDKIKKEKKANSYFILLKVYLFF